MISKEELKQMYYYVGIIFYEHKLVRVFKTKTNYDYVFYYDNNGKYSLMNGKDTEILSNQLTAPPEIALEMSPAQNFDDLTFDDVDVMSINWNMVDSSVISLKDSSMQAKIISNKDNKTVFEIVDTEIEPKKGHLV